MTRAQRTAARDRIFANPGEPDGLYVADLRVYWWAILDSKQARTDFPTCSFRALTCGYAHYG